MTTTLTKLPGFKWWIETDDTTGEIVGQYHKPSIVADIAAIRDTLAKYPDQDQEAGDYADVLTKLPTVFNATKTERITAMLARMWEAYGQDPRSLEVAQLRMRLEALIALRDRLV